MKAEKKFLFQIESVALHPDYDPITMVHDIALLRLKTPITITAAAHEVCLPELKESFVGQDCVVTGWGILEEGQPKQLIYLAQLLFDLMFYTLKKESFYVSW